MVSPVIDQSLVEFFTSTSYAAKSVAAVVGKRVHVGKVPKNQANLFPRLFLRRSSRESNRDIDGGGSTTYIEDNFDLEVISNASTDILKITNNLWNDVDCCWGSISTNRTVKGIFLENQDDSYEPKGTGGDLGLDIASFNMRVVYG